MPAERARVLIADGSDLYRAGLRTILGGEPRLELIAEASDGWETLELCRRLQPDLVVMELQWSGLDGCTAIRRITRECPATRVVVVTFSEAAEDMRAAASAGASGYLLKSTSAPHLLEGVQRVLGGEHVFSTALALGVVSEELLTHLPF